MPKVRSSTFAAKLRLHFLQQPVLLYWKNDFGMWWNHTHDCLNKWSSSSFEVCAHHSNMHKSQAETRHVLRAGNCGDGQGCNAPVYGLYNIQQQYDYTPGVCVDIVSAGAPCKADYGKLFLVSLYMTPGDWCCCSCWCSCWLYNMLMSLRVHVLTAITACSCDAYRIRLCLSDSML